MILILPAAKEFPNAGFKNFIPEARKITVI
jgi:hypothetical protein